MQLSTGKTMDDPNNIPGGLTTLLGLASASIVVAVTYLRRIFSHDRTERVTEAASQKLIAFQLNLIEANEKRYDRNIAAERVRTQEARESLDAAVAQIDALRQQVHELSNKVAELHREIASLGRAP